MNCQQAKPLIDPYADGELGAATILELEQHLQTCATCGIAWRNAQTLKKALKQEALYFTAPEGLRRRIESELPSPKTEAPRAEGWSWDWLTAAWSGLATAGLALLLTLTLTRPSSEQRIAKEVVSSHVRSLMADHILDVVSTDQHTVKPWFNGKLDFSPPVKNLAEQGFPLIGGRLDYVDGRNVSALIFQRHQHVINLFIWPAKEEHTGPTAITTLQGYNVIRWSGGEMAFWAASDLNEKELMEFAEDFGKGAAGTP